MSLKTIFDLPTSKDQLEAANSGFASWKWQQKAPLRNIQDSNTVQNFNRGQITYRWDMASSTYFMPSKCFLRMRCKLTKGDNVTPLEESDQIGPSMGLISNLMSEMNVTINDQQVSVADRHIGEIESMYHRINKSGQWMRDCGNSVNFWESSLQKRIQDVSSDGLIGDVVGDDSVEIKSRVELGFPAAITITVAAATHILTFAGAGAALEAQNFKAGDIIVIHPAGAGVKRAFYVLNVITALTLQLASFGTTIPGDIAAAAGTNDLERFRYSPADVIDYLQLDAAVTQPSVAVTNVITANAGSYQSANPGNLHAIALNGTTIFNGEIITENLTNTTVQGSSFNVATVVAAGAANPHFTIRWKNTEITNLENLGYVQDNQNNGHAATLAINAGGNALLTITSQGSAGEVPSVREHFKIGDIIIMKVETGPDVRQLLVVEIDPTGNDRSLGVIGSSVLLAGEGVDGRDFLFQRIRLNGAGENKLENKARQLSEFEVDWTPRCLSFFRLPHSMPGGAKFQLNITPKNLYREAAIESLVNKTAGTDYNFQVLSCFLYIPTFEGRPHIDKYQFYLDLNEIRCQKVDITSAETSYTLDVRPSTNALAIATQSSSVDNSTNFSSSKFTSENDYHRKMTSFHVRYGKFCAIMVF